MLCLVSNPTTLPMAPTRGSARVDDLTLINLLSDRDRLARELDAYAMGKRSITPSGADIADLQTRLEMLDRLIARQTRAPN